MLKNLNAFLPLNLIWSPLMRKAGILISYHCPLFQNGTVVGKFFLPDLSDSLVFDVHPDIKDIPFDQLHLFGIEVFTVDPSNF